MASQSFDDLDRQRTNLGLERIGPGMARGSKVELLAPGFDPRKHVHDISIRVITETDVEDDVAAGHRVTGIPQAFHPRGIAGLDVIEGGRGLVAYEIVLGGE